MTATPDPAFIAGLMKPGAPLPPGVAPTSAPAGTPGTFAVHAAGAESALQPGQYTLPPAAPQPPANWPAPPAGHEYKFVNGAWACVPVQAAPVPSSLPPPGPIPNPPVAPPLVAPASSASFAASPPPAIVVNTPAAAAAAGLPAFLQQPVPPNPGVIGSPPINPPESRLPPAPPVGVAAPAPAPADKPKRGRPAGSKNAPAAELDLDALGFPREEFAKVLELWAANVRAGKVAP